MNRVIIESPYGSDDPNIVARNVEYLNACIRDAVINHNESPYASHRMLTEALDDREPNERTLGIEAGLLWSHVAVRVVVYTDLGITPGMIKGLAYHDKYGHAVMRRRLPDSTMHELRKRWEERGWPTE